MPIRSLERAQAIKARIEKKTGPILEINFITLHYAYFAFTSLLSALIFWGSSTPVRSVKFIDALFLCTSAMTEAGLNTVNLSTLNSWQQVMLFLLILGGSAIWVSFFVVLVRLRQFEKVFHKAINARRLKRKKAGGRGRPFKRAITLEEKEREELEEKEQNEKASSYSTTPQNRQALISIPETAAEPKLQDDNGDVTPTNEQSQASSSGVEGSRLHLDGGQEKTRDRSIAFEPDLRSPIREPTDPAGMFPPIPRAATMSSQISQTPASPSTQSPRPFFSFNGVGATASSTMRHRAGSSLPPRPGLSRSRTVSSLIKRSETHQYFHSAAGHFGRNSQVYGLTIEERQELGGCEYSAIMFLAFIVPFYFFIWQFLGALALGAWVNNNRSSTTRENGINPWWVGSFNAVSAFNNSGMSLLDANMTAFSNSVFMCLSMGLFILAGNTAYPIFLRMAVWAVYKILLLLPDKEFWAFDIKTLRFLLEHPRRCYTNMFPAPHTWWLGLVLITLNGIDWAMFEILNAGNHLITRASSAGLEVVDGLFQALAVRSGGFYVVPIPNLRISLQFLYVVMMYISAYPIAITMRNSNVYEESSLGIFAEEEDPTQQQAQPPQNSDTPMKKGGALKRTLTTVGKGINAPKREERTAFVRQQIRAQLSHDAWWICLAIFLILILEAGAFEEDPKTFSVFNIIFEVVSGYSCVGMTVGVPFAAYSFSGGFRTLSKLIMVAVMLRGRHRGLPVAIDQAIHLPKEIEGVLAADAVASPLEGPPGGFDGGFERVLGNGQSPGQVPRLGRTFTMPKGIV